MIPSRMILFALLMSEPRMRGDDPNIVITPDQIYL